MKTMMRNHHTPIRTANKKRNSRSLARQQHRMVVGLWSNGNSRSLLVGLQTGTATLEDSLAGSYKAHSMSYLFPNWERTMSRLYIVNLLI